MDHAKEQLFTLLHDLLRQNPAGLSEYELLTRLKDMQVPLVAELDFSDRLGLFRAHFLLFHHLYHLRDRLEQSHETIDIHCLKINLRSWQPRCDAMPDRPDDLGCYYRDITHLEEMTGLELEAMVGRLQRDCAAFDQRPQCLKILGLAEPVSRRDIKRRFRELALTHHPDRGGDPTHFRRLHRAADTLLRLPTSDL